MKLPEKYRGLIFLALLLVILPLAVYSLALKKTAVKHREYRSAGKELTVLRLQAANATQQAATGVKPGQELIASGRMLDAIADEIKKNSLSVHKYTPYTIVHEGGIVINTGEAVIAGGYAQLVRLMEFVEKDVAGCRIISVNFRSSKEARTGKVSLTATMVLQQIMQT